jgi:uncharacterized protein YqgC (DUF456 family)
MTPVTAVAFALLVAGVVTSALSRLPGALVSLAGVYLYWWGTGYAEPSVLTLGLVTAVAGLLLAGQAFRRFVASRVEGASTLSATLGALVGIATSPFLGTTGLVLGTLLTVFVVEYVRHRDAKRGLVAALAVVLGTVSTRGLRVLLTGLILLVMVIVVAL